MVIKKINPSNSWDKGNKKKRVKGKKKAYTALNPPEKHELLEWKDEPKLITDKTGEEPLSEAAKSILNFQCNKEEGKSLLASAEKALDPNTSGKELRRALDIVEKLEECKDLASPEEVTNLHLLLEKERDERFETLDSLVKEALASNEKKLSKALLEAEEKADPMYMTEELKDDLNTLKKRAA